MLSPSFTCSLTHFRARRGTDRYFPTLKKSGNTCPLRGCKPLSCPFWRNFFCHSVLVGLLFRSKGHLSENSVYFKKSKLYFLKSKPYFFGNVMI